MATTSFSLDVQVQQLRKKGGESDRWNVGGVRGGKWGLSQKDMGKSKSASFGQRTSRVFHQPNNHICMQASKQANKQACLKKHAMRFWSNPGKFKFMLKPVLTREVGSNKSSFESAVV